MILVTCWQHAALRLQYQWPDINSHFGIIDAAGFPKERYYYYQTWFLPNVPSLFILPHWKYVVCSCVLVPPPPSL
jgi:hypothetical protein